MESLGTGAGLAALGFWLFVASAVFAGVWGNIRKREANHETLRRALESGQPLDEALTDKLLALTGGDTRDMGRDYLLSGMIMFSTAIGLAFLGWALAVMLESRLLFITFGVAPLVGCIGVGFLLASYILKRREGE